MSVKCVDLINMYAQELYSMRVTVRYKIAGKIYKVDGKKAVGLTISCDHFFVYKLWFIQSKIKTHLFLEQITVFKSVKRFSI